ncbi:hypothetical protein SNE40_009354 [Patella caerulea]|uniref:Shugoshin C-terminal domain-containing protein n=1 Tax=Patella caerulea TaxID=87958 RepID=A0AAN8JNQ4_PATCE
MGTKAAPQKDLNLSNSEDDVFMKSRSARKRKAQGIRHRLNSSSKKKKIISCKLSTSSTGSFSKENLRGKNKKLAVDLQKLKITLSKLNREYVALQKYNQEAMVTVRRKRAQVNDIQNHIKNETKMRIQVCHTSTWYMFTFR